jgi:MFS superfamily sulfate permease-like transporter
MSKKIDEIELHSKEVQDLMGRMPSWLIRNGIVMVILLLMMLVVGSWVFKYPDVIIAPVVVTATPNNPTTFVGCIQLKMNLSGKVQVGQRVNLKFANYPYMEYGVVKGVVGKISSVPNGDSYALEVNLPGKMVSTFGKKFEFQQELKGTAEIIMEDRRLLDRILHPAVKY